MQVAERPPVAISTGADDPYVYLPRLKNAHLADRSFTNLGLCNVYTSVDFFKTGAKNVAKCKAICGECTVTDECLRYSIVTEEEYGVWGGMSEDERRPLINKFRKAVKDAQEASSTA